MDILLQSDGQLYPPRRTEPKPPPPKKPAETPPPPQPPPPPPQARPIPWEDILLIAVAFAILRNSETPDIPLLIALAYILFDRDFSLKGLL